MKEYKVIRPVAGVTGVGCADLVVGEVVEMTDVQALARTGKLELVVKKEVVVDETPKADKAPSEKAKSSSTNAPKAKAKAKAKVKK
jgi:hypothetical protein